MEGQLQGADGTLAKPTYSFASEKTTGLHYVGANNIALVIAGANIVDVKAAGVTVTGTLGVTGDFKVATTKFTVTAASGNTVVAGTLGVTGVLTASTVDINGGTIGGVTLDGTIAGAPTWTSTQAMSVSGNAATATLAATSTVVDSTSATTWLALFDAATGSLAAKTDAALIYDATTGTLTSEAIVAAGNLSAGGGLGDVILLNTTAVSAYAGGTTVTKLGGGPLRTPANIFGGYSILELAIADDAVALAGQIQINEIDWTVHWGLTATKCKVAAIEVFTHGSVAGDQGGEFRLDTKADGGVLAGVFAVKSDQMVRFAQPVLAPGGAVGAPGLSFDGSETYGFYLQGAAVSTAVAGVEVVRTLAAGVRIYGHLGFGVDPAATSALRMAQTINGGVSLYGLNLDPVFGTDGTTGLKAGFVRVRSADGVRNTSEIYGWHIGAPSLGAGHTATSVYGLYVSPQTGGSGASWGIYVEGSTSYFGGAITAASTATISGTAYIGDTSNARVTRGLTINQGAADDTILALKSSDVATVLTSALTRTTETDDYATFSKASATLGGLLLQSLAEDDALANVTRIASYGGTATTTKSTAGRALIELYASEHNGENALADVTSDGNVFGVIARRGGADVALMLLDEDADLWLGGALACGAITSNGGLQTFGADNSGGAGYRLVLVPNAV